MRAFPTHFASILYFISSKNQFSILTTHFYKTPLISFFILQYILLKYYKIIFFLYIFFSHPNQTHGSRSVATAHNPHTYVGKPKPTPPNLMATNQNTNPHHHNRKPQTHNHQPTKTTLSSIHTSTNWVAADLG